MPADQEVWPDRKREYHTNACAYRYALITGKTSGALMAISH